MTKEREVELLEAAASAFDDGRDPFTDAFLREHQVTLDEVYGMSEFIAAAIRFALLWAERGSKRSARKGTSRE